MARSLPPEALEAKHLIESGLVSKIQEDKLKLRIELSLLSPGVIEYLERYFKLEKTGSYAHFLSNYRTKYYTRSSRYLYTNKLGLYVSMAALAGDMENVLLILEEGHSFSSQTYLKIAAGAAVHNQSIFLETQIIPYFLSLSSWPDVSMLISSLEQIVYQAVENASWLAVDDLLNFVSDYYFMYSEELLLLDRKPSAEDSDFEEAGTDQEKTFPHMLVHVVAKDSQSRDRILFDIAAGLGDLELASRILKKESQFLWQQSSSRHRLYQPYLDLSIAFLLAIRQGHATLAHRLQMEIGLDYGMNLHSLKKEKNTTNLITAYLHMAVFVAACGGYEELAVKYMGQLGSRLREDWIQQIIMVLNVKYSEKPIEYLL